VVVASKATGLHEPAGKCVAAQGSEWCRNMGSPVKKNSIGMVCCTGLRMVWKHGYPENRDAIRMFCCTGLRTVWNAVETWVVK
jgi:hypothetical protein